MATEHDDIVSTVYGFRSATKADSAFVADMARHACVIEDWPLPAVDDDEVLELLPAHDDLCVVAVDAAGGAVGAVWTFRHTPPLLTDHYGEGLPEIAIAVAPDHRGKGVGGALLDELFARSTGRHRTLALNVHQRNPARRLYERNGFRAHGQGRGALGVAMVKKLPERVESLTGSP